MGKSMVARECMKRSNAVLGASLSNVVVFLWVHIFQWTHLRVYSYLLFETKRLLIANDQMWNSTSCVFELYQVYNRFNMSIGRWKLCAILSRRVCARSFYLLICCWVRGFFLLLLFSFWFTLCNYVHVQIPPERIVVFVLCFWCGSMLIQEAIDSNLNLVHYSIGDLTF